MTAVPPVTQPWPYTLTVEIRPMPEEWLMGPVKVFNLNTGERLEVEWYTRWNRAYSQFVMDGEGMPGCRRIRQGREANHGQRLAGRGPGESRPMTTKPLVTIETTGPTLMGAKIIGPNGGQIDCSRLTFQGDVHKPNHVTIEIPLPVCGPRQRPISS